MSAYGKPMEGNKYHFINSSTPLTSRAAAELARVEVRSHAATVSWSTRVQPQPQPQRGVSRNGRLSGNPELDPDTESVPQIPLKVSLQIGNPGSKTSKRPHDRFPMSMKFRLHVAKSRSHPQANSSRTRLPPRSSLTGLLNDEVVHSNERIPLSYNASLREARQPAKTGKLQSNSTRAARAEQKILRTMRHSLQSMSNHFDPFVFLPVTLDRTQKHLLSFYLGDYAEAAYGFSPHLQPHPAAVNFAQALIVPTCFQVVLAMSALRGLSLHKYASEQQKTQLEMAMIRYRGEALRSTLALGVEPVPSRNEELLCSVISLGRLDQHLGAGQTAGTHYAAVRRILKTMGGPLAIKSVMLSRTMCFESMYGTSEQSFVWDNLDLERLLDCLNSFLHELWEFWRSLQIEAARRTDSTLEECCHNSGGARVTRTGGKDERRRSIPIDSLGLRPGSVLLSLVQRQSSAAEAELTQVRGLELIFQVTCLLTLGTITMDLANDLRSLQQYMYGLHKMMDDLRVAGQSCANAVWQIHINDHSEAQSRRVWRAASYAWVMKHASYTVQTALKDWFLRLFTGKPVRRSFQLHPFHLGL